jgi:UDPglucose 6-dehydrogenase
LKITVVGIGYVGLANAVLLAQNNEVVAIDLDIEKVNLVNKRISPIEDKEIKYYFKEKKLHLQATISNEEAFKGWIWYKILDT